MPSPVSELGRPGRPVIKHSPEPWRVASFFADTKFRVKERYWRNFDDDSDSAPTFTVNHRILLIPDARSWRQYLAVWQRLCQALRTTTSTTLQIECVFLESVAECLDHRSQSHGEATASSLSNASSERMAILKLLEDSKSSVASSSFSIRPFCDLSVRETESDEWEWLDFPSMTVPQRSRQALLRAARLLQQPNGENDKVHVVISDEQEFKDYYQGIQMEEGVSCTTLVDILKLLGDEEAHPSATTPLSTAQAQELIEMVAHCKREYERLRSSKTINHDNFGISPYLTPQEVQLGLKNGSLVRGTLQVSRENPAEAFVTINMSKGMQQSGNRMYFVDKNRGHFHWAFHRDTVVLEILPESEWGCPEGKRRLVYQTDDDADDAIDRQNPMKTLGLPPFPSARVVAIDKPSRRSFVATLTAPPRNEGDSHVLVAPMDVRIPKIRVDARNWRGYIGNRLHVHVDGWDADSKYPHGRCTEIMGPVGDLETEISALMLENQIQLDPFSAAALACLPPTGPSWSIPEKEVTTRRDFRSNRLVFSVDPPGCQDIDDSMHAYKLPNGDVEVGVHIADVTHFVPHASALDREAQTRGTTFYLVDRRFDMLPSILSSNLCSLHGGVDRLAVSVVWTLSADLKEVKDCWYGRTVIHNVAGKKWGVSSWWFYYFF